jgi:hypothetical protein
LHTGKTEIASGDAVLVVPSAALHEQWRLPPAIQSRFTEANAPEFAIKKTTRPNEINVFSLGNPHFLQ